MARESPSNSRRWLARIGYTVLALLGVAIGVTLAVPPLARWQLESRLTEALERPTTVESVAFNPFSLRLTIRNIAVADRSAAQPLLAFEEMLVDLSSASVWHWAPVIDALKLTRPRASLARDREGRFNIQDLIERALAPSEGPPPRFSLNNVEIEDGSIAFDDGITGRKHRLDALAIGVPFLSSLPYETEIRVTPRVAGTFNDSRFALAGSTTPFAEHRESTLDIDLDELPLRSYVAYLPLKPRVELADGSLTTRLKVLFVDGKSGERRAELRGDARIDNLAIKRRDGSSLAAARRLAVAIDRLNLVSGDAAIASVAIDAPSVDVKRLADGEIEWTQPLFDPIAAAAAATPKPPGPAPQLSLAKLTVDGGSVSLTDETSGFRSSLVDASLVASNVSTKAGEKAQVKLAFVSADRIASFTAEALVEPMAPSATGRFALSKFSLGLLFPYYKSALAVDVQKGSLDLAAAFAIDATANIRLTEGEATIRDLQIALSGNRDPLWRVPRIAAAGVDVDVGAASVTIAELNGTGAALKLVREADGSLAMSRIVKPVSAAASSGDKAWSVVAKKLALERVAIDVEDRVPKPAVKLAVRDLSVTATDVSSAATGRSNVSLKTRIGDRGRLAFGGQLARSPLRLSGEVDGSGLAISIAKPYVEPLVNVVFGSGIVAAKGRIAIDASASDSVQASWKGNVSITDFAALDKPTAGDLARWKSLQLDGVDVATKPFRASVARVGIDDFFARVIIYADGTLNLARLLTPGESPEPQATAAASTTAGGSASPREALPISIGRIEFDRGNMNFSDFFVKPNYSANLTDLKGSVSAMSADLAGDVAVVGRVDRTAPVEVQGRLQPFAKELTLDIAAKARDIDLPPLSPYAVKYAGYGISKGKLTMEVRYQVENRKLAAENHLVLDQLTFGERVESPTATKLPVLLAVALLKDSRGVIDIQLPISGSLDDPQFSVGGLIIRVIVNLITKAATAPFALLSAAFGGSGEELSTLAFDAGSSRIEGEALKRIDTLAKALADRPGVKLEIGGRADPTADREALRRASVDHAIKRAKLAALAKEGASPPSIDDVTIASEERARWLAQAYRDAPLPDRPRNVFGQLKDVPPGEMEAALYASAVVDDDALRLLANRRAQAAKDAIAAKGVAGERLFIVAPRIGADQSKGQTSATLMRVDLALG